jgi:hypothetical protein
MTEVFVPVVVQLVTLSSLLCTAITAVEGFLEVVHAVAPGSEVVPLANVKSSNHTVPVLVLLMVTVVVAVLVHPFTGLVTVKLYTPATVTTGFCAVEVKLFGPVQLYVTPGVEEEPESVTGVLALQETDPLALALAPGPVVFRATNAVSVPEQPVDGLNTVNVYVPAAVTTGFWAVEVKLFGPVQL